MACQHSTSGRRVGSNGGLGAVGVTSRGEPRAGAGGDREAEVGAGVEAKAEAVPLTVEVRIYCNVCAEVHGTGCHGAGRDQETGQDGSLEGN